MKRKLHQVQGRLKVLMIGGATAYLTFQKVEGAIMVVFILQTLEVL